MTQANPISFRPYQSIGVGVSPQPQPLSFGNSVTDGYDSSRYAQSNTARNLALAGAGLQAVGSLGQAIYGGRQQRRQAEENKRAIGRANLISILSGGSVTPAPDVIQSRGSQISQVLAGVGGNLSSLGDQLQKLRESEITLRMAEDAAMAKRKQDARQEESHKILLQQNERNLAAERGANIANKVRHNIAKQYNFAALQQTPDSPLHQEIEILQGKTGAHATLIARQATFDVIAPLFKDAIAQLESGFDYSAEGPVITSGDYEGDRAYGKYQVMGKNIPAWSEEALGYEITPDEFLADKDLQETIAGAKLDEYLKERLEKNPQDTEKAIKEAAVLWFGGRGNLENYNSKTISDRQVDSEGNVTFDGKSNYDYTNTIFNTISENAALHIGYGNVEDRFSDEFTLKRLEKQELLGKLLSPEFQQELVESNDISPELQDAFLGSINTQVGVYMKELEAERSNIMTHFQSRMQHQQNVRMDAAAIIDKKAASHLAGRKLTQEAKQQSINAMVDISNDWIKAWEGNKVIKDYKEFIVAYTKLNELSRRLYGPDGKPLDKDSPEFKQLHEDIKKGAYDIGFVNVFQRLIDPATVREGDIELYRNNTPGALGRVWIAMENLTTGGALLTPETLVSMVAIADDLKRGMDRAMAYETLSFVEQKERSFAGTTYPTLVKHLEDELFTAFNVQARNYITTEVGSNVEAGLNDKNLITRANLDERYKSSVDWKAATNAERKELTSGPEYTKAFEAGKTSAVKEGSALDAATAALEPEATLSYSATAGPLGQASQMLDFTGAMPRRFAASQLRSLGEWMRRTPLSDYPAGVLGGVITEAWRD